MAYKITIQVNGYTVTAECDTAGEVGALVEALAQPAVNVVVPAGETPDARLLAAFREAGVCGIASSDLVKLLGARGKGVRTKLSSWANRMHVPLDQVEPCRVVTPRGWQRGWRLRDPHLTPPGALPYTRS